MQKRQQQYKQYAQNYMNNISTYQAPIGLIYVLPRLRNFNLEMLLYRLSFETGLDNECFFFFLRLRSDREISSEDILGQDHVC